MLSFRKKILFSDLFLFLIFIALLFPFVEKTVGNIVRKSLEERANELIEELQGAPNLDVMIQHLKSQELYIFFRVSLLDAQDHVLYDSHVGKLLKGEFTQDHVTVHPEVKEALKKGIGYSEGYSKLFAQSFAYVARSFQYHGQTYVLRTAFPFRQVEELTSDFEFGFLTLGAIILLLYSVMTWAIIHRLSNPIQQIINGIKPYQEGKLEFLPHIELSKNIDRNDDFGRLADTLNSLTERIQRQIQAITKQRNENEGILESLVEGVMAVDSNNVVTFANSMASKMLGLAKNSFVGHPLETIQETKAKDLIEKCKELVATCQQKSEIVIESFKINLPRIVYFDIIAAPKAHKSGAILVIQDKTSDFRVLEMGKDFVANASHELRTPITIIRGFAETLHDLPEIPTNMLTEITGKMVRTCDRLDAIIKNLLTLTDIENMPASRLHQCDIETFVDNCIQILLSLHPDAVVNVDRRSDEEIYIAADYGLMELAVLNLLENAVKYSNPPAEINIILEQFGDEVCISVIDKGIGIPPQDLEHIFERFFTVDKARSRRFGGAGLGLSIVKTIINKHGGKISATSTVGKGTCFTILMPSYESQKSYSK